MNREQAKKLLPIIQAFAEGRDIEYRSLSLGKWIPASTPSWEGVVEYRIKPEPREWWIDLPELLVYERTNPPYPNAIKVREVIE